MNAYGRRVSRSWLAAAVLFSAACGSPRSERATGDEPRDPAGATRSNDSTNSASSTVRAPDTAAKPYPTAATLVRTQSAEIALRDLDGLIEQKTALLAKRPDDARLLAELSGRHASRAQYLGRPRDLARALELAERHVATAPRSARAYIGRADAYARVHRFAAALGDLDRAAELGAHPSTTDPIRATISQATGDLAGALAIREAIAKKHANTANLGSLALVRADLGERAEAERLLRRALDAYRDVSPMPVAWICFQWGRLYERAGELSAARELYQLARARLPAYAEATAHLAGVLEATGDADGAAALLRALMETAGDPEYPGQLAAIEAKRGNADAAARLAADARRGYEALLAELPEAYADHAARFYLAAGADPARAHHLAQKNLAVRQTAQAYQLALDAALAAGETKRACVDAAAAIALVDRAGGQTNGIAGGQTNGIAGGQTSGDSARHKPLLFAAWRAFGACGDGRADALAARLGIGAAPAADKPAATSP